MRKEKKSMANGTDIINYAKRFVGEGSARFSDWYYGSTRYRGWAWCNVFVSYCMIQNGLNFKKTAYVPDAEAWMDKNYSWVKMGEAQAGDIIIFCWSGAGNNSGSGSRDHIGFFISNNGNGTFTTIEGNTSGSQVAIRTRSAKNIRKIFRPTYSSSAPAPAPSAPAPSVSSGGGSTGMYYVNSPIGLNVRSGPGTNYGVVQTLANGTPIKVLEVRNGFGRSEGAHGWLSMQWLSRSSGGSSAPSAPSSRYGTGMYHVNAHGGLRVRAGAGTGYSIVQNLPNGTPLKILKVAGDWGYSAGARGWVHLGYCRRG